MALDVYRHTVMNELSRTKITECNNVHQLLNYDKYGSNKIASQKEE